MNRADHALYTAKAQERNRVRVESTAAVQLHLTVEYLYAVHAKHRLIGVLLFDNLVFVDNWFVI